jgi:hypothetical protein
MRLPTLARRAGAAALAAAPVVGLASLALAGPLLAQTPTAATGAVTGVVTGVVTDSVAGGRPLVGAMVQLVRADDPTQARSVVADSLGAFLLDGVPAGRYLLGFLHPRLDALRLQPPVRGLDVTAGGVLRADLAVPSGRAIATAVCGALAPGDSAALLVGRVSRAGAESTPVAGEVTVEWLELVFAGGGVRQERRVVRAPTDAEGHFALCGVPTDLAVLVQASSGDATSGKLELEAPPRGVLVHDLLVARPVAVRAGRGRLARGAARVRGRVLAAGGGPFAGAQVLLHGSGLADTTDADGAYALDSLPTGTYMLEGRAMGFAPRRVAVDLRDDRPAVVNLALDARVPMLETVAVYGRRSARHDVGGFLRRAGGGSGHFITADAIEERHAYSVPDLLRMTPGVRVQPSGGFGTVITMRGPSSLQGECLPAVFLDGVFLHEGAVELERTVTPAQVLGIEIYNGPATVPAEFQRGQCGAIVVWTKR